MTAPTRGSGPRRRERIAPSALILATAAAADGGPAAALPVSGSSVLGRLVNHLQALGIGHISVVTRPAWTEAVRGGVADARDVGVVASDDVSEDLRTVAEIARRARGPLIIGSGHVLTHREALAGLLADPRILSGVLATHSHARGLESLPMRSLRGRVVSAGSPYHRVQWPNSYFLAFIKLDPRDRDQVVAAAEQLAELAAEPRPARWTEELDRTAREWRLRLWRAAVERTTGIAPDPADLPDPASFRLDDEVEEELAQRLGASAEDALPLLFVGLVRTGVQLSTSSLRGFFFATPLSRRTADLAVEAMSSYDEDRVALDAAVKAKDGFFTTFFVSPYSKYLARFAARRGWSPNAITTLSFGIGVLAAAAFAAGNRAGLIAGAVLLQVSFTVDCVDGQLARYTRTFSRLGAWLDSVFDRAKEYLVYGGLAIGATRGFGDDVWILAAAALTLQTFRHMVDFSYGARQQHVIAAAPRLPLEDPEDAALPIDLFPPRASRPTSARAVAPTTGGTAVAMRAHPPVAAPPAPGDPPSNGPSRVAPSMLGRQAVTLARELERRSWGRWGKRILVLPIGERFALISLTAAIATPRVTFVALLAWGGIAAAYLVIGRVLSTVAR